MRDACFLRENREDKTDFVASRPKVSVMQVVLLVHKEEVSPGYRGCH